ncbi:MAG: hypothetical protein HOB84_00395 [Candidatus Marinimicrobia bacterium]|jgi:hypothetical protein|nr:hypothetical protein [Candidatus Neomarinimicrobiota bacterium]MBT4359596.1 hypothetical protein [Candidatus Neomarinimicrobiota bacterium]MBT4713214.1 hypothetical protein [Candidatus Neomarinimicrobiota bacterium]MBT4945622.1 hypothetical protein [Candidatus Neomarinimicrobiota bacterium]MBT5271558.1 hypothetical protein [Candidatus Neomarinimicrobiota bacterium]
MKYRSTTLKRCGLAKLVINDYWLEQMISFPHTAGRQNSLILNQKTPHVQTRMESRIYIEYLV